MEKLNIAEILKDCPKGMELDCSMYDNVTLYGVFKDTLYPIKIETPDGRTFLDKYGCCTTNKHSKCVIYPKGKTTWEGFQRPFKDGDVAVTKEGYIHLLKTEDSSYCAYRESWRGLPKFDKTATSQIKLVRLATEDEKQKLFDAIKDNGYKWNAETKTLEKLHQFKSGDVLVSHGGNIVLCSYIDDEQVIHYHCVLDKFGDFEVRNDVGVGKESNCTLASECQKQKLFDELKRRGYSYNLETNKLEKLVTPKFKVGDRIRHKITNKDDIYEISKVYDDSYGLVDFTWMVYMKYQDDYELVPNKFDITTLKPFDKVLVRIDKKWWADWFSHIDSNKNICCISIGVVTAVIPYEGNEHLIGTTNDCDEYYKTWK